MSPEKDQWASSFQGPSTWRWPTTALSIRKKWIPLGRSSCAPGAEHRARKAEEGFQTLHEAGVPLCSTQAAKLLVRQPSAGDGAAELAGITQGGEDCAGILWNFHFHVLFLKLDLVPHLEHE